VGRSSTSGYTGGYSYWALLEPFVILYDVQFYCIKTQDDRSLVVKVGKEVAIRTVLY